MTDFNNSNNKEESVKDTLRRVMTERGYFANPVTIHTEIGDFTSYADEDSPLVKKNQAQVNAHNPFEPQAEIQVKPPFSSAYQGTAYNNNSQEVPAQQNGIYSTNNESLIGRPSSYFQNNNTVEKINNQSGFDVNNDTTIANATMRQQNNSAEKNNSIIQSTIALNPINAGYQIGQRIGELAADTKLAYDYWQKMNQTGNQLVKTFGNGQGADIDNYYHPLLQCELAKISPQSRNNGIALGYAKEYLMDYPKKSFFKHQSHDEIVKDSQKDLQNNLYGSNLGYTNPNGNCEDLLDDRRTPNMRKLGIR